MRKGYKWPLRDEARLAYGSTNNRAMICTVERFYKRFRDAAAQGAVDIELKNRIYEVLRIVSESMLYEGDPVILGQLNGLMRKILHRIDRRLLLTSKVAVCIDNQDTTLRNAIRDRELAEFREMYFLSAEACRLIKEGEAGSVLVCNGKRFVISITDQKVARELSGKDKGENYGGIQAWNWHYYRDEAAGLNSPLRLTSHGAY